MSIMNAEACLATRSGHVDRKLRKLPPRCEGEGEDEGEGGGEGEGNHHLYKAPSLTETNPA
jgi:hypothetical protein